VKRTFISIVLHKSRPYTLCDAPALAAAHLGVS